MSTRSVKSAIDAALVTTSNRTPQVTRDEARAIVKAATEGTGSAAKVSKEEAALIAKLAGQSTFESAPKGYKVTDAARRELDSFFTANQLPFGANAQAIRARVDAAVAGADLSKPLAKAPSTSALYSMPLDGGRVAYVDTAKSSFFLKVPGAGREVRWFGPLSMNATAPANGGRDADLAALKAKVETSMKDVLYMSESDYPVEFFLAAGAGAKKPTGEEFLSVVGKPAGTPVETRSFADFFDHLTTPQEWWEDSQKAEALKYGELRTALEGSLTDLQVIRVGEIEIGVYVVGRNQYGDLVGVKTTSIET